MSAFIAFSWAPILSRWHELGQMVPALCYRRGILTLGNLNILYWTVSMPAKFSSRWGQPCLSSRTVSKLITCFTGTCWLYSPSLFSIKIPFITYSGTKGSQCHCLQDVYKQKRPMENCLPTYHKLKKRISGTNWFTQLVFATRELFHHTLSVRIIWCTPNHMHTNIESIVQIYFSYFFQKETWSHFWN